MSGSSRTSSGPPKGGHYVRQSRSNCAVIVVSVVSVNVQVDAGGTFVGHGAVHASNTDDDAGLAVSTTTSPDLYGPGGLAVTVPAPVPELLIVS